MLPESALLKAIDYTETIVSGRFRAITHPLLTKNFVA
jgi:hypothetical protein